MACDAPRCDRKPPGLLRQILGAREDSGTFEVGRKSFCSPDCLGDGLREELEEKLRKPVRPPLRRMRSALGLILQQRKRINPAALAEALARQRAGAQGRIGDLLLRMGLVTEHDITLALSRQFGIPWVNFANSHFDPALAEFVPAAIARAYRLLPVERKPAARQLLVAVVGPPDFAVLHSMGLMVGMEIVPLIGDASAIQRLVAVHYPESTNEKPTPAEPAAIAHAVVTEAARRGARRIALERCARHLWARLHASPKPIDLVWELWREPATRSR